jgi:hypothetical protein
MPLGKYFGLKTCCIIIYESTDNTPHAHNFRKNNLSIVQLQTVAVVVALLPDFK